MEVFLEFEATLQELQSKINDLSKMDDPKLDIAEEIDRLKKKHERIMRQLYSNLTPWQKVQVARHQQRPRFLNMAAVLFQDFMPLAGDRCFGEDEAIIGGLAKFQGRPVMVIGQERGQTLEARLKHNFGMPKPEGYRKAQRLMRMANTYGLPILTFIDTPGAYPGIGAEERGQAEAIAKSVEVCLEVEVPIIATVIGEGGSGGAIALGVANTVMMFEHAVYSVISPEGCASILWRSSDYAETAADALKITAQDLQKLKIIDAIITEPLGGAQRNPSEAIASLQTALNTQLQPLLKKQGTALRTERQQKFLAMGRAA